MSVKTFFKAYAIFGLTVCPLVALIVNAPTPLTARESAVILLKQEATKACNESDYGFTPTGWHTVSKYGGKHTGEMGTREQQYCFVDYMQTELMAYDGLSVVPGAANPDNWYDSHSKFDDRSTQLNVDTGKWSCTVRDGWEWINKPCVDIPLSAQTNGPT